MRLTVCALIALLVTVVASAVEPLPDDPGIWRTWVFEANATDVRKCAASAKELQDYEARLQQLRAVIAAAPAVAEPRGFDAKLVGVLVDCAIPFRKGDHRTWEPLPAVLHFGAFERFAYVRNGETHRDVSGETSLLEFVINRLDSRFVASGFESVKVPDDWLDVTRNVFLEPPERGEFAGIPRRGNMLIIRNNPAPLWVPVTLREAIDLMVQQARLRSADFQKRADYDLQTYREEIAPDAKARLERAWELMAARKPDRTAYLAHLEEMERQHVESMRKGAESNTPTGNQAWAAVTEQIEAGERQLAGLAEVQGTAPACYRQHASAANPLSRLGTVGEADCVPVVRPNSQYFDARLPRSAVQLITIPLIDQCTDRLSQPHDPAGGCVTNMALLRSVDWQKVKALMDR